MKTSGAKLSEAVIKHVESVHNGLVTNVIVAGKSGCSDLIACINGKYFALEIKGDDDTEKPLQDEHLKNVARAGGYGGYVYSVEDAEDIITNLKHPDIPPTISQFSF
jgi:hypothetical protein